MFYEAIREEPSKPTCEEVDLLDFCKTNPSSHGEYQPVVTIELKEGVTEKLDFSISQKVGILVRIIARK